MAYSKKVVDKFENTLNNPQAFNVGRFDPSEENIGTGMVGAPACGDVMKLQIKCEPSGNTHIIKDAPIPSGSSLVPIGGDQKLVLTTGDAIKVSANTASSVDVVMSVLQST